MSAPEFGTVAPCRTCKGTGQVRGSGMDDYQRRALRQRDEPVPTMHKCDACEGRGFVPVAVADRPAGSEPPPGWAG